MGNTSVQTPQPPAAPSTAESVEAYINSMPRMYQTQLDWGGPMAQQQLDLTQQFGPQYMALQESLANQYDPQKVARDVGLQMQYAPQLVGQQQDLTRQYEPESYAAKEALGGMMTPEYLSSGGPMMKASTPEFDAIKGMVTPEWMTGYNPSEAPGMMAAKDRIRQDTRGAWASRGMAQSGMSAEDESRLMAEFEFPYAQQQEQMRLNELGARRQFGAQVGQTELGSQENALTRYYTELGRRQNLGLSMAGRLNVPSMPTVNVPQVNQPQFNAPNMMEGYNYGQVANNMQTGYGNYSNLYGNMYGSNQQQAQSNQNITQEYMKMGMQGGGQMLSMMSSRRFKKNIKLWE